MKPGSTSEKEYLLNQLNAIEKTLKKQFGETYKQAINLGEIRNVINSGDSFSFDKNPSAKKKVDSMLKTLQGNLTNTVSQYSQTVGRVATQTAKEGVKASVSPSKKEQDFVDKLSDDAMKDARKSASESAGEAKMSSSVWNFDDYSKKEIQAIINAGIRKGLTVQGIADSVTPYLNNPLLEDAEPEFQKIQTPKGVYKSAYKNALRLARTEVMRAYDEAEWNSYQNDPMVVGFEVKTSNNHTVLIHGKRVPLKDMCDQLAGKYPKSFKFTGWHPQCRCTMLPITIGADELGDLMEAQENGEEFVSKNTVSELPENFNEWYDANKDRFSANNEPWFLSENKGVINTIRTGAPITSEGEAESEGSVDEIDELKGKPFLALQETDENPNNRFSMIAKDLEKLKIEKVPFSQLPVQQSSRDLAKKIGHKDTEDVGSCVSLSLAYMGNRLGYDVQDFRGGKSRDYLSSGFCELCISEGDIFCEATLEETEQKAYESITEGEEVIFGTLSHATIVQKKNGKMQYLELQGEDDNKYKPLTTKKLLERFGYPSNIDECTIMGRSLYILRKNDIVKNLSSFKSLLEYINTARK